ncbi:conjugal transfer protein TraD [Xanthomonas citri]|uniref:conjugal transfer protein TraD n=1 Tax=Xanthomonas citri TaxID=346 RepID=UPI0009EB5E06|nr:conjugal transfer protein TraD [Xanthomonas citri]
MDQTTPATENAATTTPRRGRRPSAEMSATRRQEIARLERIVTSQKERLAKLKEDEAKAQRSARRAQLTRLKIEAGGLVSIAGLLEEDRGFLLGALIGIRETRSHPDWTPERYQAIKQLGDKELAARETSRKTSQTTEE